VISQGPNSAHICQFLVGDGSGTAFPITHNLDNYFPIAQVYKANAPREQVVASIAVTSPNDLVVTFAHAPAKGEYIVVIVG
jgi:hypothetical protein